MTRSEYKEMMLKMKTQLKGWAKSIKEKKAQRKGAPGGYVSGLDRYRYEARHHHIVYCEMRGREREDIEQPRIDNMPNQAYIDSIYKSLEVTLDEVIRSRPTRSEHPAESCASGTCSS